MGSCLSIGTASRCPTASDLGLPSNFKVIRELGYGVEGKTYLVKEYKNGKGVLFACKVVPRGGSPFDPEFVLKGLRNQCSLCFVHVVKFLEVLLTPSHLIIKFEYVSGGDLFKHVSRQIPITPTQHLDEEHARFLFIQILHALAHCHEHRVAHRDIKFANILCTSGSNPIVKICDFGLSKAWERPQDLNSFTAVGTPIYMSPEMMNLRSRSSVEPYDPRKSDVWGLGIILYTMLLGKFPFLNMSRGNLPHVQMSTGSTSTFSFLLKNIERAHRCNPSRLKNDILSIRTLSKQAKKLLESMLCVEANKRITIEELLEHPWVRGPISLKRARVIGRERWDKKESSEYVHAELVTGSSEDRKLQNIVYDASRIGSPVEEVSRWSPPGIQMLGVTEPEEISRLEEIGIRICTKCSSDDETDALGVGFSVSGPNY